MKVHLNAQAKEYNHNPSDTFWETHGIIKLAPMEGKFAFHSIQTQIFTTAVLSISYCKMDLMMNFTHPLLSLCPSLFPVKVLRQQILPAQYENVVGDNLINLAVVLEDMATQERVLASEEFNIASPQLTIQVL